MKDEYKPEGHWVFDEGVAQVFDDMLERSIPQYSVMRDLVYNIAKEYIQPRTSIVDIGCSRGQAIGRLASMYSKTNSLIGVDISQNMLDEIKNNYPSLWDTVDFKLMDLRYNYLEDMQFDTSVTLVVLTLQFIPIEYRQRLLRRIYETTTKGGVIILVEKILGNSSVIDDVLVNQYYNIKNFNGYSKEDIVRKRLALEGVLVPMTAKWNEEMLYSAGFNYVDSFWRYLNFAGWIGVKE